MRALLLALWLVWASVPAGYRTFAPPSRDGSGARVTSKDELAVLTGVSTSRLRSLEAREPQPAPVPDLPPVWWPSPACRLRLPLDFGAPPAGALERRRALDGLGSTRSSRGPPLAELQIQV